MGYTGSVQVSAGLKEMPHRKSQMLQEMGLFPEQALGSGRRSGAWVWIQAANFQQATRESPTSLTDLRMQVLHLLRLSTILQLPLTHRSSLSAAAAANTLLRNSLKSPEMASAWQCMNTYPSSPSA